MFTSPLNAMLLVKDVVKSVKFYKDVLGFTFSGYWDGKDCAQDWKSQEQPPYAGFDVKGAHLGIHPTDPSRKVGNSIELHMGVENADKYYQEVKSRGGDVTEPKDTEWGARMFQVKDPDGHIWDFYHMLDPSKCSS